MKTINNVQKTNLKSVTAGLVLAVLGFSVNAQGALHPDFANNTKTQLAFAGTTTKTHAGITKSAVKTDASLAAFLVEATEEPLQVEAWMTNAENFEATPAAPETAIEEELTIENWMLDEKNFETKISENEELQEELKFQVFEIANSKFFIRISTFEPALQFEDWMFENSNWK